MGGQVVNTYTICIEKKKKTTTKKQWVKTHKSRSDLLSSSSIFSSISPFLTSSRSSRFVHGQSPLESKSLSASLVQPRKSIQHGTMNLSHSYCTHSKILSVLPPELQKQLLSDIIVSGAHDSIIAIVVDDNDTIMLSYCADKCWSGSETCPIAYHWVRRDLCQTLWFLVHLCLDHGLQTTSGGTEKW